MSDPIPYRVVNPATGELLEEFPFATDAEVAQALDATTSAQKEWARRSVEERARVVAEVSRLFGEHANRLAEIATTEMGKPITEAVEEAQFCQEIFGYYATKGPELLADQAIEASGAHARIQRLPIGPVLGIMPWNFPFYQVARFVAPSLVVGNSVILKHAESCPRAALAIADLMREAGVPEGVYINLFATHEQAARIIEDPRVQGVSVTGSERAGAAVAEIAGRNLKKVVLELGGSDPFIVLDSADIKASAKEAWETRIYNTGQACNSNKRMIARSEIYEDFVNALVEEAKGLEPGDPANLSPRKFPPMASSVAAERLAAQIKDAVEKGATLHVGGTMADRPGAYFQPAVLTGVTPQMRAYREELFGPVAVVYSVDSDEEAIRLANDNPYGLGGAVFSTDVARATAVADALEVGMTNVNTPAGEGADLPFGGVKGSGVGRELGPLGIDEFVNKRLHYVQG